MASLIEFSPPILIFTELVLETLVVTPRSKANHLDPAKIIAQTIRSWLEPIIRMWRFSKSNGNTEGFHTKMEMISRRAFGFRNFQNYRLRVLALCGWNGVINRV